MRDEKHYYEVEIINKSHSITFDEVCQLTQIGSDDLYELIENEIIMTVGGQLTPPSLPIDSLNRISKAMRLKTQLGVNLAGISIIFDLLDEIERLKKSKNLKKKY